MKLAAWIRESHRWLSIVFTLTVVSAAATPFVLLLREDLGLTLRAVDLAETLAALLLWGTACVGIGLRAGSGRAALTLASAALMVLWGAVAAGPALELSAAPLLGFGQPDHALPRLAGTLGLAGLALALLGLTARHEALLPPTGVR